MVSETTMAERALGIAREQGVARARDFRAAGVPATYLSRLCVQGQLVRLGRGLYQLADFSDFHAAHDLTEVTRRVPHGVVCLLSALRLHDLTTQLPPAVWIAIAHKARSPSNIPLKAEIVRASGPALSEGIMTVVIEGVSVPVYSPAKTVADCFKYRRRVGLEIAVEALRDAIAKRKATRTDLWHYAQLCRVRPIMRPYLEAFS
ncbi:MAG: type IV toxin-antitoxin system AbiEi family antitoxin domain-containing protein [Alphaproteobacteria bacterium]|nr:type IV toxin-antitoxin system AbiEi family antitoxin domain-containing protein [Alphaproteobacteria bacterium]